MSIQQAIRRLTSGALAFSAALAFGQTPSEPLTLQRVLQAAGQNIEVQLASQNLSAAQADIVAADHAPAPVLSTKIASIDLQNGIGSGNLITQKRIDKSIGVDYTWERGNKRVLRTQAAKLSAQAAGADVQETRIQQQMAASVAFFDLAAAQERLERVQAMEASAQELARAAARRVLAGDLAAQDASRADIEARRAGSDTLGARLDLQRSVIALQNLIAIDSIAKTLINTSAIGNLAPGFTIKADWIIVSEGSKAPPLQLDGAALQTRVEQRADVLAAQERVKAAQAQLDAAGALKKADVTWGASYDHFPGTSNKLFELRASMPMQWDSLGGYNFAGEEQRARAQLLQAQSQLDKLRFAAQAELLRLQQEISIAHAKLVNFSVEILPRARQVLANAELAYGKGAMSLTDLIEARRTFRATQLDTLSAKADYTKALTLWQLRTEAPTK